MAYFSGDYEQRYTVSVSRIVDGAEREGVAVVDASKEDGGWQAQLLQMDIE